MNIPIDKKVQAQNIFMAKDKRCFMFIEQKAFIGTNKFVFDRTIASKGYIGAYKRTKLESTKIENKRFDKYLSYFNYESGDKNCTYLINQLDNRIFFRYPKYSGKGFGCVILDYKRYSYFKKFGCEFRFSENAEFAGLFLNLKYGSECVGIMTVLR
ncbi:TPA: hypothetical protein KQG29_001498 [Clostridioides difficile]|nr:hypothetical protein [Clostridioides difficile]